MVGTAQVKSLIELGSKFQDMSERTGVAVETLQELDYALKQSGSSAENAEKAFRKLGEARQKALADPKGAEAAKFNTFGIGDVLFTTPLIKNIKRAYPTAEIHYLANSRSASDGPPARAQASASRPVKCGCARRAPVAR